MARADRPPSPHLLVQGVLPEIVSEPRNRLFGIRRIPDQRETATELVIQRDLDDAINVIPIIVDEDELAAGGVEEILGDPLPAGR